MRTSDSIAQLAAALCKAQSTMTHAIKDANNPFFHSKYADLASVVEASRPSLAKNGLSVVQCTWGNALFTRLLHDSGEWIEGSIELKPMRQVKDKGWEESHDPQSYGSCITYARRYAMAAITGVATEDDDGNAASGNKVVKMVDVKPGSQPPDQEGIQRDSLASHPPAPAKKSDADLRHDLQKRMQQAEAVQLYPSEVDALAAWTKYTGKDEKEHWFEDVLKMKGWQMVKAIIKADEELNMDVPL